MFEKRKMKQNEIRRDMILRQLDQVKRAIDISKNDKARGLKEHLGEFERDIRNHPLATSPKILITDTKIRRYLIDIKKDLTEGEYGAAQLRIKKLETALSERLNLSELHQVGAGSKLSRAERKELDKMEKMEAKKYKVKGDDKDFPISDLYTNEELYDLNLAHYRKVDEDLTARLTELSKGGMKEVNARSEIKKIINQRKINRNMIKKLEDAAIREYTLTHMQEFNEEAKMEFSTFSQRAAERIIEDYNEHVSGIKGAKPIDLDAENKAELSGGLNIEGTDAQLSSSLTEDHYVDSLTILPLLIAERDEKMQELNKLLVEINKLKAQLAPVVEKYKTASATEAKIMDSYIANYRAQIEQQNEKYALLEAERNQLTNEINKYNRVRELYESRMKKENRQEMLSGSSADVSAAIVGEINRINEESAQSNLEALTTKGAQIDTTRVYGNNEGKYEKQDISDLEDFVKTGTTDNN